MDTIQFFGDVTSKDTLSDADKYIKKLNEIDTSMKSIIETTKSTPIAKSFSDAEKTIKAHKDSLIGIEKVEKERKTTLTNLEKAQKQLTEAQSKEGKELVKLRTQKAEVNKQTKQEIKLNNSAKDSINALNAENAELAAKIKKLSTSKKEDIKLAKQLNKQIDKNTKLIQKNNTTNDKRVKGIGQYTKGVKNAVVQLGAWGLAIGLAIKGIGKLLSITSNFAKQMSKVRAVTGATVEETQKLTESAIRLGSATSKSVTEVAQLQEEFAKLGFSTAEILNATEATISLAEATGSELAESAVVAASTVRGFGLDASQTQRVVDVMAKSFTSSALDLQKFSVAMAAVAPVAKSAGVSLETATSQLSVLVDAGLDASTAGTSLRNIFLDLSAKGLTYEEALEMINTSTNKNVTALELFGKRGATTALLLAENQDKALGLADAYDKAAGSAAEMARIVNDNLAGDIKLAQSAWEGLILSIDKGDGIISRTARNAVKWFTDMLTALKQLNEYGKVMGEGFEENLEKKINSLADSLTNRFTKKIKEGTITSLEAVNELSLGLDKQRNKLNKLNEEKEAFSLISKSLSKKEREDAKLSFEKNEEFLNRSIEAYKRSIDVFKSKIDAENKLNEEQQKKNDEIRQKNHEAYMQRKKDIEGIYDIEKKYGADTESEEDKRYRKFMERQQNRKEIVDYFNEDRKARGLELFEFEEEIYDKGFTLAKTNLEKQQELGVVLNDNEKLLISERLLFLKEQYEEQRRIHAGNNEAMLELDRLYNEQRVKIFTQGFGQINEIAGQASNTIVSIKDAEIANIDRLEAQGVLTKEESEEKKKQAAKKYADFEFAATAAQIISSTALAIARQYADLPLPAAVATSILVGAAGAAQLITANQERQRVKALATGEVDIQGAGTTTSDSIPAMLSKGETVHKAKDTKRAYNFHNALNKNKSDGQLIDALLTDLGINKLLLSNVYNNSEITGQVQQENSELIELRKNNDLLKQLVDKKQSTTQVIDKGTFTLTKTFDGQTTRINLS